MSSTYRAICIAHTPALVLGEVGSNTAEGALGVERNGPHAECELLVGRWSGALVELGCPPPGSGHGYHPHDIAWADAAWLRVAVAAAHAPVDPAIGDALSRIPVCWRNRLAELKPLLISEAP